MEESRSDTRALSKEEMSVMLRKLEEAIKMQIGALRVDMSHLLTRVEETEARSEQQALELNV